MAGLLSTIAGWFRSEPATLGEAMGKAATGRIVPDLPLWYQLQRIGGSVTPQTVSAIIRQADAGDMTRLMDLANDCRQKDTTLQQVLQQRESGLTSLEWELYVPGESKASTHGNARGVKEKAFVSSFLDNEGSSDGENLLDQLVPHLMSAPYYGYAVSEIEWGLRSDGRMVPTRFENLAPRRFAYNQRTGAFIWRDQGMSYEGIDIRSQYPGRFVINQPRITGDVPCREGLVRVLMWAALFRNWSLADWLKLAEMAWKPWRVATYTKDASNKTDVDELIQILEGMTSNGVGVMPANVDLKVMFPGSSGGSSAGGPQHAVLFDVMGREMAKATLGQTLTTQEGNSGTQALGTIHEKVAKRITVADAKQIARVINRDLIAPAIRINFGENAVIPRLRYCTDEPKDLVSFGTALTSIVASGLKVPTEWAYRESGIPAPNDGEECIEAPAAKAAEPDPNEPDPNNDGSDSKADDAKDDKKAA